MISQNCPVCHSSRIRKGYHPTPIWSRLLFRFNLLCDSCNWEFVGFALPLFTSSKRGKGSHEQSAKSTSSLAEISDPNSVEVNENSGSESEGKRRTRIKKKIRIRI